MEWKVWFYFSQRYSFQKSLESHCCLKLPKSVCHIGCLETLGKLQFAWGVAEWLFTDLSVVKVLELYSVLLSLLRDSWLHLRLPCGLC